MSEVKMAEIVQAAQAWQQARQAVIDEKNLDNILALYAVWTEAEDRLAELVRTVSE